MHRGVEGNASAHRVANERRFRHARRLQKPDEKIDQHPGVVVRERLVGFAEANLIEREDVKVLGERLDVRSPSRSVTTKTVQQHHWRPVSGLEVVQLEAEDGDVFPHHGVARLSRGHNCHGHYENRCRKVSVHHAPILAPAEPVRRVHWGAVNDVPRLENRWGASRTLHRRRQVPVLARAETIGRPARAERTTACEAATGPSSGQAGEAAAAVPRSTLPRC